MSLPELLKELAGDRELGEEYLRVRHKALAESLAKDGETLSELCSAYGLETRTLMEKPDDQYSFYYNNGERNPVHQLLLNAMTCMSEDESIISKQ